MFDSLAPARLHDLHFCHDPERGLNAIIAIHSTRRGPALGGCRCLPYPDNKSAIDDAIALARGMSYKAAMAGLPLGGGKSVIILPRDKVDRQLLFQSFGEFVESLGGRYITAMDSGTELTDLDQVARSTRHVVGTDSDGFDPSPLTARGVLAGIRAAVRQRLDRDSLSGLTVAIQGAGHVGSSLARQLAAEGVRLIIADIDPRRSQALAAELQPQTTAQTTDSVSITGVHCDVFSPCALGGVLTAETIAELHCSIVAGAANNQLANADCGKLLNQRNILYAPDYVINAGGLIRLALSRDGKQAEVEARVDAIGATLSDLFARHAESGLPTNEIADRMAEEALYAKS